MHDLKKINPVFSVGVYFSDRVRCAVLISRRGRAGSCIWTHVNNHFRSAQAEDAIGTEQ
jgi:hypothetical protein